MPTLSDLRYLFYGGGTDAEYEFLQQAYDAGISAVDLLSGGADWTRQLFLDMNMTNTNWATVQTDVSQRFGFYRQSTGAQNAQISLPLIFDAGTYSLELLGPKGAEYGIATISLDGVDVGSIDLYNAATVFNQISTGAFVVSTGGKKTFALTMKTKNASNISANYFGVITRMTIKRTA